MIHGLVAEKVAASIGEPNGRADKRQKKTGRRLDVLPGSILTVHHSKNGSKKKMRDESPKSRQ